MSEDSESKGELMRQLNEQSSQIDEMVQNINALEIEKKQQEIKFNSQKQEH